MALEEAYCQLYPAECERIDVSRILSFTILFVIARLLGRALMNCLSSDSSRVRAFGYAICGCTVLAEVFLSGNRMDIGVYILVRTVGTVMGLLFTKILKKLKNCDPSIGYAIVWLLPKALHDYVRMDVSRVIGDAMAYLLEEVILRKLFEMLYHGYKKRQHSIQTSLQFQTDHVNRRRAKASHV